jgi:hypothetical protein
MNRTAWIAIVLTLTLAAPALAGKYESRLNPAADLPSYGTWDWDVGGRDGNVNLFPGEPVVMRAVETELAARGYRHVSDGEPDLEVAYAIGVDATEGSVRESRAVDPTGVWVTPMDTVNRYVEGNLIVLLIDAASGETVWEGMVRKAIRDDKAVKPEKLRHMIRRLMEPIPASTASD